MEQENHTDQKSIANSSANPVISLILSLVVCQSGHLFNRQARKWVMILITFALMILVGFLQVGLWSLVGMSSGMGNSLLASISGYGSGAGLRIFAIWNCLCFVPSLLIFVLSAIDSYLTAEILYKGGTVGENEYSVPLLCKIVRIVDKTANYNQPKQ